MRDFKGMKRQRGRNRGGGGGGGGGKPQHNANRAFDSNGPDGVKIRGAAQHVYEKYQALARDAGSGGDRVLAENYLQHAEHYFRVLRAMQPQRPVGEIIGRDQFVSGYDIDFEDENGAVQEQPESAEGAEAQGEAADGEPRERQDRWEGRQRDDRPRDDRPREDRPRDDRPRDDRYRDDRPRERDRFRDRDDRRERPAERDPLTVVEPEATPLVAREAAEPQRVLRADDGEVSHTPAFLQVRPAPEGDDGEGRPRTRRRRAPRTFDGAEAEAPADADES